MDDYGLELSGLDPDSIAELRRLRKEQRMAEAMMQQGEQPLRGQMVGGVYVRPSIFQGLAGMANTYAGNKRSQAVDEGYRSLSEKRKAVEAAAFDKFQQGFYGSPEKTEQLPEGMFGPPQTTPAVVPDMNSKQQAIIELLRSQSPTAKMVAPMMNQELNRQREQQEFRDALKGAAGGGQLTGFEPMQNGVPGQQGMVGDPQNLIQDIAMNPDMSNEDKQAAIAQIRQQSAGAGGGQIDPRAMLLSGNPKAMQVGQFLEGQQDKKTLATQRAQDALEKQRQHDQVMAGLRQEHAPTVTEIVKDGKVVKIDARSGKVIGDSPTVGKGKAMSATAQKELIQTDEEIQGGQQAVQALNQALAINDQAMGFAGAGMVSSAGTLLPEGIRPKTIDATQNLDNILQSSALPQLKAIFGGMPTEGERKILLEVQGSSSKSPAVRKEIFDRAIKAAEKRIEFSQKKAKSLREGTYFSEDQVNSAPAKTEPSLDDILNKYK